MKTELLPTTDPKAIAHALQILRRGGLVAFPTDTVYGIGGDVFSESAIQGLFLAKDRDTTKAIPVLVGEVAQLSQVTANFSGAAERLARRYWPGALTLIVSRHPSIPAILSPLPTVGVRMPNHPLAIELLRQSGPLATTSANISGGENTITAQDVFAQLEGRVDLILDGGACPGGLPSTVVDCTTPKIRVLRQGPISLAEMEACLAE